MNAPTLGGGPRGTLGSLCETCHHTRLYGPGGGGGPPPPPPGGGPPPDPRSGREPELHPTLTVQWTLRPGV